MRNKPEFSGRIIRTMMSADNCNPPNIRACSTPPPPKSIPKAQAIILCAACLGKEVLNSVLKFGGRKSNSQEIRISPSHQNYITQPGLYCIYTKKLINIDSSRLDHEVHPGRNQVSGALDSNRLRGRVGSILVESPHPQPVSRKVSRQRGITAY